LEDRQIISHTIMRDVLAFRRYERTNIVGNSTDLLGNAVGIQNGLMTGKAGQS
jgi:hypothetical protein